MLMTLAFFEFGTSKSCGHGCVRLEEGRRPTRFVLAPKAEFDRHRQTVAALASMDVRLSHLLSSGQDQIFVLDREQRMIAFFGYWPEDAPWKVSDLLGKRKREIFPPEISAIHEAAALRALNGEEAVYEWSVSKPPRPAHLFTAASPLRNDGGAIVGVLLVTRDVTTLKEGQLKIERALNEKTSQLLEVEGGLRQIAASFQRRATSNDEHRGTSGLHTTGFLTSREYAILGYLRKGLRLRSIAQTLGISVETVRRHLKAMFRKTGVHSQEALIKVFSESGERS